MQRDTVPHCDLQACGASNILHGANHTSHWNKGKLIGQKAPLKLKEIWAIRIRLRLARRTRDLALFNLAIDS
jgi:hypothetical protein